MKKGTGMFIACLLCLTSSLPLRAAQRTVSDEQDPMTTQVTSVRKADYIVSVPREVTIAYDRERNPLGSITYTYGNLDPDAYVSVTLEEHAPLCSDAGAVIPYEVYAEDAVFTRVDFAEETAWQTSCPLWLQIEKKDWEAALAGHYSTRLTFQIAYHDPHAEVIE